MTAYASYSPDDNKIRLYGTGRLDAETWARAKALGFLSAPKQGCIVAPAWSPGREDFVLEFVNEIQDEDMTLAERQDERADRFEDLSANRARDADAAYGRVRGIMDAIPPGQPVLVGHHSERGHRADLNRMDNAMRKSVVMSQKSEYWQQRAEASRDLAHYKELPAVRARRIRTLETEKRKIERRIKETKEGLQGWKIVGAMADRDKAMDIVEHMPGSATFPLAEYPRPEGSNSYLMSEGYIQMGYAVKHGVITLEKAVERMVGMYERSLANSARWIEHYDMRLTYERAMLDESGGIATDQVQAEAGGAIQCLYSPRGGWSYIVKVNKVTVTIHELAAYGGKVWKRNIPLDKIGSVMTKGQVDALRDGGMIRDVESGTGFVIQQGENAQAAE